MRIFDSVEYNDKEEKIYLFVRGGVFFDVDDIASNEICLEGWFLINIDDNFEGVDVIPLCDGKIFVDNIVYVCKYSAICYKEKRHKFRAYSHKKRDTLQNVLRRFFKHRKKEFLTKGNKI